ncbi:glutathione S-transferase [Pseudooceanicola sp.]|uniref:glutathione S-transferase n=1 Tax=Pseudooceanicola sp. TaxID=1914328 RepID=UPI0026052F63|nr:glutathione S-transferase [Pseudooceanicola sp.]MDF1856844.1 glutathione S-transferase [Pseudooceanicola sp.]
MMKLHWSPRSPFVRKVMIVAHETGLQDEIECVRSPVGLSRTPDPAIIVDNPLCKIPTLVTEDGLALFDSRVICEYLDLRTGTGLFPSELAPRMAQIRWQALADGMTDILLIWRTELTRETGPWQAVVDVWSEKVRASMQKLEDEAGALASTPFGIGQITVICALGQLDLRWPESDWRRHFPMLAEAEANWKTRPSVAAYPVSDGGEANPGDLTKGHLRF